MPFFNQAVFKNLAVTFAIAAYFLIPPAAYGLEVREVGVVRVNGLNMRTGPSLDQPIIKILQKDAHVRVLSHHQGWVRISHDGDLGYIADRQKYVTLYTIHTVNGQQSTDIKSVRQKAQEIRQKIKDRQAEVVSYTREEREVVEALEAAEQAIVQTRQKLRIIQSEIADVDKQIMETRKRADELEKTVAAEKEYALKRLVALYKMNRIGAMNLLASAESMHDLLIRKAAMTKILDYDQRLVADLLEKQVRLTDIINALSKQKGRKHALEAEYASTIARLKDKNAERKQILAEIRTKKANRMATLKYLKNAAARLDKTVAEFQHESMPQQLSGKSFSAYQGLLNMPVKGKIIAQYGKYVEPRSGVINFRNGIEIKSPRGTPIRVVFPGKAIYADWLKGYGNVIIIAHGNGFHTVYAHAEEVFLKKGDPVDAGDVIGTVGDSGTMSGAALYFEIRHHGDAVNPAEWIDNT